MTTISQTKREEYQEQLSKAYQHLDSQEINNLIDYLIFLAEWEIEIDTKNYEKKIGNLNGSGFK